MAGLLDPTKPVTTTATPAGVQTMSATTTSPAMPVAAGSSATKALDSKTTTKDGLTQSTAYGYDPTKQTVSDKSLVQNQVKDIVSSGSPLMTLAETEAKKQANKRGLLNSSIAVGAGQEAVLKQALPIAQQDAGTFADADRNNAAAENTSKQFNAGSQQQNSQFNSGSANTQSNIKLQGEIQKELAAIQANSQMSLQEKQIASNEVIAKNDNFNKLLMQQMDRETKTALAKLDEGTKMKLAQVDSDNRQLLQTNISAANMYAQYATNLANIQGNKDMGQEAKDAAVASQLSALQAGLSAIGKTSGLNLSEFFQAA